MSHLRSRSLFSFSNHLVEVPARRGMAGVDAILRSQSHQGTYLGRAVAHMNGLNVDRLVAIAQMRTPHMRWLFVEPALCLQLPSDPASRRRPCCSANGSHHQGPHRTLTSKSSTGHHSGQIAPVTALRAMPGAPKKGGTSSRPTNSASAQR